MNDSTNNDLNIALEYISLTTYLNISLSFLLEKFKKEQLIEYKDENGWNLLHWFIAEGNCSKVKECIDLGFNPNIQSSHSSLAPSFLEKHPHPWKKYSVHQKGFTPLHLNVILHSEYDSINQHSKQKFVLDEKKKEQELIFSSVSCQYLSMKDADGLSVTDYCFMLENIKLIHLILNTDPSLESLSSISTKTALNIVQHYQKSQPHVIDLSILCSNIIENLEKKLAYEQLNHELPVNFMLESKGKL